MYNVCMTAAPEKLHLPLTSPISVQQGGRVWELWLETGDLPLSRANLNGGKTKEPGGWHFSSLQEEEKTQDHH